MDFTIRRRCGSVTYVTGLRLRSLGSPMPLDD